MSSADFEQTIKNLPIWGQIISVSFGESKTKERFAYIINKVVWYKCRLYIEVDKGIESSGIHLLAVSEHVWLESAKKKCEEWAKCLTMNSSTASVFGK